MTFIASLVLLSVALLLFAVTLWNAIAWRRVRTSVGPLSTSTVSILIPARDEEQNLAACLEGVLVQGEVVHEILVYDDHSTDKTQRIAEEYSRRNGRIRIVPTVPLVAGWCGKTFACAQLAAKAKGAWLLFIDADARLRPGAVSSALAEAEARNVSLLSCWPSLELVGFRERLLMPLLNFVVFTLYPAPLAATRMDPSLGLAHGSFILAHRDTYTRLGGHEIVRAELFEDVRLAQAWRACGERSLCLDGQGVLSVRMYSSFREIWNGFQKNFFPAFRSDRSFVAFIGLHLFLFLLPFLVLPVLWTIEVVWPLLLTALIVLAMRLALAIRFKHPIWSVILHPIAECVLIALGISSWWVVRFGHGVQWKGRSYLSAGFRREQTEGIKSSPNAENAVTYLPTGGSDES